MPPAKKTPWGLVIGLVGLGIATMGLIAGFLGYAIVTKVATGAPPRNGFGSPVVVQKVNARWTIYSLPEIPMQIMTPGKPHPTRFDDSPTAWATVSSWITYDWTGWGTNCCLAGVWYKHPERYNLDICIKHLQTTYASWSGPTNFKSKIETRAVGRLRGRELVMSYRRAGHDEVMRLFLWEHDGGIFYLVSQCYKENREEADKEYDQTLRSIQFR